MFMIDLIPSPGPLRGPTSPMGEVKERLRHVLILYSWPAPTAAPCGARRRAAPLRRSNKDCRPYATPARRIRRHDRGGAERESPRRVSPAPPAADWPEG